MTFEGGPSKLRSGGGFFGDRLQLSLSSRAKQDRSLCHPERSRIVRKRTILRSREPALSEAEGDPLFAGPRTTACKGVLCTNYVRLPYGKNSSPRQ